MQKLGVLWTVSLVILGAGSVSAQTQQFLKAPTVRSQIRVEADEAGTAFKYQIDTSDTSRDLPADKLFLAKSSIYITVRKPNPLRTVLSAKISDLEEPSNALLSKLLEGLLSVSNTLRPPVDTKGGGPPPDPTPCAAVNTAASRIAKLDGLLFGPSTTAQAIKKAIEDWRLAIDNGYSSGKDGPGAIADAVVKIDAFAKNNDTLITSAAEIIKEIDKEIDGGLGATTPCESQAFYIYHLARLSNPRVRLQQLVGMRKAAEDLSASLVKFSTGAWITPESGQRIDKIISIEIKPNEETAKHVVVTNSKVKIIGDETSGLFSVANEDTGSVAFDVRMYSLFAIEAGGGVVFSTLTAPKYGTTEMDGKTVVARLPDEDASISPTAMVNFVCRCYASRFVPMAQIGVQASKTTPAILYGGGIRLFGIKSNDVAIGGGWVQGWVKDLKDLDVGDEVGGTADIAAKQTDWVSRRGKYFVIQIKF